MHTLNLDPSLLDIRLGSEPARLADLFPLWGSSDRLGVVIGGPMGAVGAGALIAAAIARFYGLRRESGATAWVYPEIYAFHAGRPFGDFSYFDFLPARKEVVVTESTPLALLEAVNDRAITHLAVPDAVPVAHDFIWQELNIARERIVAAFVYGNQGTVEAADVSISLDPALDNLALGVVSPDQLLVDWDPERTLGTSRAPQGDGSSRRAWLSSVRSRMTETTEAERTEAAQAYEALRRDGRVGQSFRRVAPEEAFACLAGVAPGRIEL